KAVADRAHDRHRAADSRLVSELPALARRQRQQRRAGVRNDLLVGGNDRLAGCERLANPARRRLEATNRLDDHVDIPVQDVVVVVGPADGVGLRHSRTLLVRTAVADVRELEVCRTIDGEQAARDGGTDGAETDNRDASVWTG